MDPRIQQQMDFWFCPICNPSSTSSDDISTSCSILSTPRSWVSLEALQLQQGLQPHSSGLRNFHCSCFHLQFKAAKLHPP